MKKITRGLRCEPLLIKRCEERASSEQLKFSEWVRQVLRREVGLDKRRNGIAK